MATYVQGLGIDNPLTMHLPNGENVVSYWYHTDALGSMYQMTGANQAVAQTYDYSAFGTIIYPARERGPNEIGP
ncbi:MAG: hypothetical protein Kow0099_24090 [Candidatus Abyssubacteria bacterium]